MKKEEFNYLYSFKYKGKDYVFLTSKNYPFYFLEYNFKTKNFDYPDIETFKDLFNKFHSTNNILAFNKEEGFKKLRGALSKAKLKIKPLVKKKKMKKKFISLIFLFLGKKEVIIEIIKF